MYLLSKRDDEELTDSVEGNYLSRWWDNRSEKFKRGTYFAAGVGCITAGLVSLYWLVEGSGWESRQENMPEEVDRTLVDTSAKAICMAGFLVSGIVCLATGFSLLVYSRPSPKYKSFEEELEAIEEEVSKGKIFQ